VPVRGIRRKPIDTVGPPVADLSARLAKYTWAGQIRCKRCGKWVAEEEAQAQRWGYWSDLQSKLYPFCPECAECEFGQAPDTAARGHRIVASRDASTSHLQ
jgi:hypothetical protein